ncbi:phosphotransferase [Natronosporangium hydrolyticum]|uniref:Phosphotransferase n=1 Tax=Natronosporangium hydrolyticum TaxID=2811111 RepID=A0A895YFM4_9ACTN|nr:phosphotransferase [Natronosporangium hydrolyticum]QSB14895.1 phosphotransferase [Natronosporangium hydrolyticum]
MTAIRTGAPAPSVEQLVTAVADTVRDSYDLRPSDVRHLPTGTSTVNFLVTESSGGRWFAKLYRDRAALPRERDAITLAEYARAGHVPVPAVRRTCGGELVNDAGRLLMSLWEYVADAETAEAGLAGGRWSAVGTVLGRLHRRLAEHPAATPALRPASRVRNLARSRIHFDRLINEYGRRGALDPFEAWALDAARQRRALLDRVAAILARLPMLTGQVVHGDLAAPNLMLRGDEVAAVIDFLPPTPRYVSWEIARIGCDPRTILLGDEWITGLPDLLAAYREEHPAARLDDLLATVAVGCAYTLASSYPLAEPLDNPGAVDASLQAYGRARHQAALLLLERLDEAEEVLRSSTVL